MQRQLVCLLSAVLLCIGFVAAANAQEWTRFRGPNGSGQSEAKGVPATWTEKDYNWKVKLPGIGHSSTVHWGDKIFLLSADSQNATRYVICLSAADGKQLWVREYKSDPHHLHLRNSFASATPAVDEHHVYVAWSTPEVTTLLALDHDGKPVWDRDLGPFQSMHGFGTSPIVYEDMIVLPCTQQSEKLKEGETPGKSFIVAVDRLSGKTRWEIPRNSSIAAYSVPCVYKGAGGTEELIMCSQPHGISSHDPKSGKVNWAVEDAFTMRTVASPIIVDGIVIGSTGSGGGGNYVMGVKPGKKPEVVWKIETQAPYVPTPVARGSLVFLWYDKGIVTCIDGGTGEVHYRQRVGSNFSGSPIRVGDCVYCIDEEGVVFSLAADKEYKLLGKMPLGEPSRATPSVAGGRLYLRTESHLISIGGRPS